MFLNRATKVQSSKLSQRRAEKLIAGLRASEISPWWAWNSALTEWIPLRNIIVVDGKRVRLVLRPDNNQRRSDDTETVTIQGMTKTDVKLEMFYSSIHIEGHSEKKTKKEFNGDDFSFGKNHAPPKLHVTENEDFDRRGSSRIDLRIQVLLVGNGKTFRTFSDNVSLFGALLEKQVPETFRKGSFEAVLIVKKSLHEDKIVFRAIIVGDRMDPRRISFVDATPQSIKRLEQILKDYIERLKELKRAG
jgi:hypothetical protein